MSRPLSLAYRRSVRDDDIPYDHRRMVEDPDEEEEDGLEQLYDEIFGASYMISGIPAAFDRPRTFYPMPRSDSLSSSLDASHHSRNSWTTSPEQYNPVTNKRLSVIDASLDYSKSVLQRERESSYFPSTPSRDHLSPSDIPTSPPSPTPSDTPEFVLPPSPPSKPSPPRSVWTVLGLYSTRTERFILCVSGIAATAAGLARPLTSLILGDFTDAFTQYSYNPNPTTRAALLAKADDLTIQVASIGVASLACCFMFSTTFQLLSERIVRRLRIAIFVRALRQEIAFHEANSSAELVNLVDSDVQLIQDTIGEKLPQFLLYFATFVSGFAIAVYKNWRLGLLLGCTVLPSILVSGWQISTLGTKFASKASTIYSRAAAMSDELLGSIRTLHAFNARPKLLNLYNSRLLASLNYSKKKSFFRALVIGSAVGIIFSSYALAFFYGTYLLVQGLATSGSVLSVFFSILVSCLGLTSAAPLLDSFARASSAARTVFSVLEREPQIDSTHSLRPDSMTGLIQLRNVRFTYPSRPTVQVLRGASIDIHPGGVTALVGGSGSGKSTILQLILRFYEPSSGKILVDGNSINKLDLQWLRQNIGFLPQESHLFDMSIKENILLGLSSEIAAKCSPDYLEKMVVDACKNAHAHEFIMKLPEGYDTKVGQKGGRLSGGQRQRIGLARAIVSNPKILIFDEPTSALDAESEALVQAALDHVCLGKTTITVAHRLSTIRNASNIVVMNKGRVSEQGTHESLLARNGEYSQLVAAQRLQAIQDDEEPNQIEEERPGYGSHLDPNTSLTVPKRLSLSSYHNRKNVGSYYSESGLSSATLVNNYKSTPDDALWIGESMMSPEFDEKFAMPSTPSTPGIGNDSMKRELLPSRLSVSTLESRNVAQKNLQRKHSRKKSKKQIITNSISARPHEKLPSGWMAFLRIASMAKGFRRLVFIATIMTLISGCLYPALSIILGKTVNAYVIALSSNDTDALLKNGNTYSLYFFILALIGVASLLLEWFCFGTFADKLAVRIRYHVVKALMAMPISYFDDSGHAPTVLVSFVDTSAQNIIGLAGATFGAILESAVTLIGGATVAVLYGWKLAIVTIAAVPVVLTLGIFRVFLVTRKERARSIHMQKAITVVGETLSGIRVVTAFPSIMEAKSAEFIRLLDAPANIVTKLTPRDTMVFSFTQMILVWIIGIAFWFGSRLIADDVFTIGGFYTVFIAVVFGAMHAGTVLIYAGDITKAKSSAKAVTKLVNEGLEFARIEERARNRGDAFPQKAHTQGSIVFSGVHFTYPTRPDHPVLRQMDFVVHAGQSVAFVGESGSGKSTLTSLLYRFYDPTHGRILLDGQDISTIDVDVYRSQMAFVQQEPTLYDGTIRFNIELGCPTRMEEHRVVTACKEAGIWEFIESLPAGLDTELGAKGVALSGGQKQRIAIARALIRHPRILVLDEATSALDSESELHVQKALDEASQGRTTITIAHRLATVARADVIFVLAEGHIVDVGSHQELLAKKGYYSRLAAKQSVD